jgi:hypothetical protein
MGWITTFAVEAFSLILSPKDCDLNFLLYFRGLANTFSYSEVSSPERDDPFIHFYFSVLFFSTGGCAAAATACRFLETRAMGSERG